MGDSFRHLYSLVAGTFYAICKLHNLPAESVLKQCGIEPGELVPDAWAKEFDHSYFTRSPFDIFHYFNEEGGRPNSSVHVDPGLITVVPCSPVPGLEIRDIKGDWVKVEEGIEPNRFAHV